MQIYTILLIMVLSASIKAQNTPLMGMKDVQSFPIKSQSLEIKYGNLEKQKAFLRWVGESEKQPLVVIIHGGCWVSTIADYQFMEPFASALSEAGYSTYNLEYRSLGDSGGGYPGTFEDIINGINYLGELSKSYPIDLNKVIITGHSAGGHLALWSAFSKQLKFKPKGIISLAGIVDLISYLEREGKRCGSNVDELMGGLPEELKERYIEFSPEFQADFSQQISLVHGKVDPIVPYSHVQSFEKKGKLNGQNFKSIGIDEAGHFELVIPQGKSWEIFLNELQLILSK
jgi:acetyl esterase/lipase